MSDKSDEVEVSWIVALAQLSGETQQGTEFMMVCFVQSIKVLLPHDAGLFKWASSPRKHRPVQNVVMWPGIKP
jgi:hypothetical protein